MFYEVENRKNMIAVPRGYDSTRKYLAVWMNTADEREIPSKRMCR